MKVTEASFKEIGCKIRKKYHERFRINEELEAYKLEKEKIEKQRQEISYKIKFTNGLINTNFRLKTDIEELKDDIVDEVERNEINHPFNETDAEYEEWAKKTGRMDLEHVAPVEEAKTDVPML